MEELLSVVCAIDAKIRYVYHYEENLPYVTFRLIVCWGLSSGLDGQLLCELGWTVEDKSLCFHDTIKESVIEKARYEQ